MTDHKLPSVDKRVYDCMEQKIYDREDILKIDRTATRDAVLGAIEELFPNLSEHEGSHENLRFWQGFRKGLETAKARITTIFHDQTGT